MTAAELVRIKKVVQCICLSVRELGVSDLTWDLISKAADGNVVVRCCLRLDAHARQYMGVIVWCIKLNFREECHTTGTITARLGDPQSGWLSKIRVLAAARILGSNRSRSYIFRFTDRRYLDVASVCVRYQVLAYSY